jgi:hypothetical protein
MARLGMTNWSEYGLDMFAAPTLFQAIEAPRAPGLDPNRPPPIDVDPALDEVEAWVLGQDDFVGRMERLIRQGLDEVIDGGRTGRWELAQLEKTEKTYIGTKMEILIRSEFELPRQKPMDTVVAGHPVDIKWSEKRSGWQIPKEAVGHICLLVSANETRGSYEVGLVRCRPEYLNKGANQGDKKKTLSTLGRSRIRWVARGTLAPNFLATLPTAIREDVFAQPKGQQRVTRLFALLQKTPVPRLAVVTLAQQPGDPMRRIRKDKSDRLDGLVVLGGHYNRTSEIVRKLGYTPLAKDEYMSVPRVEVEALGLSDD